MSDFTAGFTHEVIFHLRPEVVQGQRKGIRSAVLSQQEQRCEFSHVTEGWGYSLSRNQQLPDLFQICGTTGKTSSSSWLIILDTDHVQKVVG